MYFLLLITRTIRIFDKNKKYRSDFFLRHLILWAHLANTQSGALYVKRYSGNSGFAGFALHGRPASGGHVGGGGRGPRAALHRSIGRSRRYPWRPHPETGRFLPSAGPGVDERHARIPVLRDDYELSPANWNCVRFCDLRRIGELIIYHLLSFRSILFGPPFFGLHWWRETCRVGQRHVARFTFCDIKWEELEKLMSSPSIKNLINNLLGKKLEKIFNNVFVYAYVYMSFKLFFCVKNNSL